MQAKFTTSHDCSFAKKDSACLPNAQLQYSTKAFENLWFCALVVVLVVNESHL